MSKALNKTALVVTPLTILGIMGIIHVASVSQKNIQLEVVTPLGWVTLSTEKGVLK